MVTRQSRWAGRYRNHCVCSSFTVDDAD